MFLKKRKGQTSAIVIVFGLIVVSAVLITLAVAGSQSKRGLNYVNKIQLDNLTEGGVYYSIATLKHEIDFNKYQSQDKHKILLYPDPIKHGYEEIKIDDTTARIEADVSLYKETDPLFNASVKKEIFEVGEFEKVIPINNASDVCFEILWDKSGSQYSNVKFEILKETTNEDGTKVYNPVKLPVVESDGRIGSDPAYCDDSNPARLAEEEIYDATKEKPLIHGYGNYKIKVSTSGVPAINLQTKGLYNRLSYRTFEVKTAAKYRNTVKKNTRVIVKASYDVNDESNMIPKFEYLEWHEGDE